MLLVAALILAALLLVGPRFVGAYTNWLWFGELGFHSVYLKVLTTRIVLFFVVAAVVGTIIWLALTLAYRTRPVFAPIGGPNDPIARYRSAVMGRLRWFGLGIPIVFGLLCGLIGQSSWSTAQLFLNGQNFGIKDPQFGLDISFYAFDLPLYRMVLNWLFAAVIMAFFANLMTHYIFGGLRLTGREGTLTRPARIQLATIAGLFVVLKAIAYWLDRYSLLSSNRKAPTFSGGSYTDINAVLPAKMILLSIAIICAVAFFAGVVLRDLRVPAMAAALLVLSSILVGAVYPLLVEQFSVRPNAADKERTYIQRNIEATRQAYGITGIKLTAYDGVGKRGNPVEVPGDLTTIRNTRLLDPNVLSPTFTAQKQLKNFYGFPAALDIDRYNINGSLRDYVVAARELSPKNLSQNQTDWINKHTVYTHGDGFVAAPANTVNAGGPDQSGGSGGYPIYTVSDLSTPEDKQDIKVRQPRIYYGKVIAEADPDYTIVGGPGNPREYDYEKDTVTQRFTYDGRGGVPVGNWFNRLAFAAKYAERNILFSGAIGGNSKIIFHRDPRDRVQRTAPWLTTDGDAYPAVVGGRVVWIVDAYTTLENYPYAQRSSLQGLTRDSVDQSAGRSLPRQDVSYIRNSVKATVDAYDGTVTLYQVDKQDPVLKTWMGVFPGVVHPESEISPELRSHFRYPEDLFKIQREMLGKYHVDDPREFFTTNAFWSVPTDPTVEGSGSFHQPPYYLVTGDSAGKPRFNLTSAMVGFNRDFLSAYISVCSDPSCYGKFTVLQLPTDTQTQGPQQTQNQMTSDAAFSQLRTLIQGSNRIQYGNLLTLPIADGGILYVEPMYTERNSTNAATFPQLSKVLVSYRKPGQNSPSFAVENTFGEALDKIFGAGTGSATTAPGVSPTAPPPQQGSVPPIPAPGPTPNPAPTPGTAPVPSSPGHEAAVAELEAAVRATQQPGSLTDLDKALERLQKAIDNYNSTK